MRTCPYCGRSRSECVCPRMIDPTHYRVTLICTCTNDATEGYGASVAEARANAIKFFKKDHPRTKWREEIVEEAVPNRPDSTSSHYEEIQP